MRTGAARWLARACDGADRVGAPPATGPVRRALPRTHLTAEVRMI